MNVVQQKEMLPVREIRELLTSTSSPRDTDGGAGRHGSLLPDSVRALVVGPSGCGKTNVVVTLLFAENGLKFDCIYLYTTTAWQPMYRFLAKITEGICPLFVFDKGESERRSSTFRCGVLKRTPPIGVRTSSPYFTHSHHQLIPLCVQISA